jgi:hypothetical protein
MKQDDTWDPELVYPFDPQDLIHQAARAHRDAVKPAFDAHFGVDVEQKLRIDTAGVEAVATARGQLKQLVSMDYNHNNLIHRFAHTLVNTDKFDDTLLIWRRRENDT